MKKNQPLVITISRQLGCGGAYVGQQLAKKLKINYADHEIIAEMAKQLSVYEKELESRDEKIQSLWDSFLQNSAYAPEVYFPTNYKVGLTDSDLYRAQKDVIERIANEKSSVIIGRCGFHILRDNTNRVSVFLHADNAFRIERIKKLHKVSVKEAEEMIEKSDKNRARYVNEFTKKNWMDATLYEVCIDTGKIGVDNSVELILDYLKLR
jgi:CMP/dCMP kinase